MQSSLRGPFITLLIAALVLVAVLLIFFTASSLTLVSKFRSLKRLAVPDSGAKFVYSLSGGFTEEWDTALWKRRRGIYKDELLQRFLPHWEKGDTVKQYLGEPDFVFDLPNAQLKVRYKIDSIWCYKLTSAEDVLISLDQNGDVLGFWTHWV